MYNKRTLSCNRQAFFLFFSLIIVAGLLLGGCQNEPSPAEDTDPTDTPTVDEIPDETSPPNTPRLNILAEDTYHHLKGELAGMEITMDLHRELGHGVELPYYRGVYRYNRFGGPISVYGYLENGNELRLTEEGGYEEAAHIFEGVWSGDGNYRGQWKHGDGDQVHDFQLALSSSSVPFSGRYYADSLKPYPHWPNSPMITYDLTWLEAGDQGLTDAQQAFLRKEIQGHLVDANTTDLSLEAAILESRAGFFDDFSKEMEDLRVDGMLDSTDVADHTLHYAFSEDMQVFYNQLPLLTLGFTSYMYLGGAHGTYGTGVVSYDLEKMRAITLDDVLLPGYEASLSTALAEAIRTKYKLGDQPLSTILFEESIEPNDNFGLTDKGIFFVYSPYEIAPYAAGEIELFVSFEKIADYVKPDWQ